MKIERNCISTIAKYIFVKICENTKKMVKILFCNLNFPPLPQPKLHPQKPFQFIHLLKRQIFSKFSFYGNSLGITEKLLINYS